MLNRLKRWFLKRRLSITPKGIAIKNYCQSILNGTLEHENSWYERNLVEFGKNATHILDQYTPEQRRILMAAAYIVMCNEIEQK